MKKLKIKLIIIITLVSLGLIQHFQNVKAIPNCDIHNFTADKETYYNDENIILTLSWELFYEEPEEAFIQVRIFNGSGNVVWQSDEYDQAGPFEEIIYAEIPDFNHSFTEDTSIFTIKIYYEYDGDSSGSYYLPDWILEITTLKRSISCDLINFRNKIEFGENMTFVAKFYLPSNNTALKNYSIHFKILSNGSMFYNNNFTTNSTGMIEIFICSSQNLSLGQNELIFRVIGNRFISNCEFKYIIFIPSEKESSNDKEDSDLDKISNFQAVFLSFLSFLSIVSIISLYLTYRYQKHKEIKLIDLTFKY
ncbi:MAG: hypothetical protein EU539_01540 [Promethearchaeota archaeon]|nr:MAG: hypothetical protein EU539_01540 [Candidatus Lokiarchaeota archaeon]